MCVCVCIFARLKKENKNIWCHSTTGWLKIFVRLWYLNDIEIKYISDKKIIKFLKKIIKLNEPSFEKKLNGPVQKNKIKLNGRKIHIEI